MEESFFFNLAKVNPDEYSPAVWLETCLSEEEADILRRARNVKSGHAPSSSDPVTYRYSTAFEGLIGYLYLSGRRERLIEILHLALETDKE
jgi:ribonuclease-3 family protein